MKKKNLLKFEKIIFALFIIIFFTFVLKLFFKSNISSSIEIPLKNEFKDSFDYKSVPNIIYNKVIIIGDSRMEYLNNRKGSIFIPTNFSFIALGGTKFSWFKNVAIKKLEDILKYYDSRYHYSVVINMGVNDLNDNIDPKVHAFNYYGLYKFLALKYPEIDFYFLSVNPVDDDIINIFCGMQQRSNKKIEKFNDIMYSNILRDHIKNLKYCDSYNNINFGTPDGLHYDGETDQEIVNYIVNRCVKYDKRG